MTNNELSHLQALFHGKEWPAMLSLHRDPDCVEIGLHIASTVSWFAGHLPGQPVLPGIVQTHWAACISENLFPLAGGFSQAQNIKFQTMITPDSQVILKLQPRADNPSIKFSYYYNATIFSVGRLDFAAV